MTEKAIEIKGLHYSYPDGVAALRAVDIDIYEGESIGVIGPNGAGKSTLLLHLNGILRGEGSVRVFGLEMKDENLKKIRSKIGLVFQDPESQLFMPTVFDDVAFGPINMDMPEDRAGEQVAKALKEVDMTGSEKRAAHHMSFGEKKRVSIATVLSMEPRVLVFDEPTSNLDPKHRRGLINLLKRLAPTKVIASHDLDMVAEVCSRVILLDRGEIAASGQTLEILKDQKLLEAHSLELPPSISK